MTQPSAPGAFEVPTVTAAYAIPADSIAPLYKCDSTGAAFAITLPDAAAFGGKKLALIRINGGANAVTVAAAAGQTINGAATQALGAQWAALDLQSDGINWFIV